MSPQPTLIAESAVISDGWIGFMTESLSEQLVVFEKPA